MKDLLPLKVATRYLGQKLADSIGDPPELLRDFERAVQAVEIPESQLLLAKTALEEWVKSGPPLGNYDTAYKALSPLQDTAYRALAKIKNQGVVADPGHKLFLAILQRYTLPAALRKKVEIASRTYLKSLKPRFKAKSGPPLYLEYILAYEKFLGALKLHLSVAKEALAQGKEHSEGGPEATRVEAGPFTLVNTGGFSDKQMAEVVEVMEKVTSLAKSSGLGEVCYGEVQVTNTISRQSVLAFYLIAKDELFIRANVKANIDTVQTVLHELGHRYEHKFLGNKRGPAVLYQTLEGQERRRSWGIGTKPKKPNPGDTLEAKGKRYVVLNTVPSRNGFKVNLTIEGKPNSSASVALDAFWALKGEAGRNFDEDPNYIGFVSDYAKKGGPSENFAEMFAYFCMNRLPVLQSAPFEELVFGTRPTPG